jgi:transposase
MDRVERLMTIPAAGPITAQTWALEVEDVQRFSSIKEAISYCGLCGAEKMHSRRRATARLVNLPHPLPASLRVDSDLTATRLRELPTLFSVYD